MLKKIFYLVFILICLMIAKSYFRFSDSSPQLPPPSSPYLKWPLEKEKKEGDITSTFGEDWIKNCGCYPKKHVGIDIIANVDDNVLAAKVGTVLEIFHAEKPGGKYWGEGIVIGHGEYTTVYIHVDPLVEVGQIIEKGQIIAKIFRISGCHLHFGIRMSKYDEYSKRGALPLKNTPENETCFKDPEFPGNFINPFDLKYD